MKKFSKKVLVLLIAATMLLTVGVGSTVAYLVTNTGSITNTFTPGEVNTDITEEFENNVKKSIIITNTTNSNVAVYVRVAIVANWVKDGQIVAPWDGTIELGENWKTGSDGYYYYTQSVAVGGKTSNLLKTPIEEKVRADGSCLVMTVIHQSIQAEPTDAVKEAWGVTVNADGTIQ